MIVPNRSMLTSADQTLVDRDAALTGLRTALDPDALVAALKPHWPEVEGGTATYVRYKPGVNCLVAHRLVVDGRFVEVYAKTYRAEDRAKLEKARLRAREQGFGDGVIDLPEAGVVVYVFPHDAKLRVLGKLTDDRERRRLFRRVFPQDQGLRAATPHLLRYKPERRYVARLDVDGEPRAVLKAHGSTRFERLRHTPRAFKSEGDVHIAERIGHSDRHGILAYEWLPGRLLNQAWLDGDPIESDAYRVGGALATLHGQSGKRLHPLERAVELRHLEAVAASIKPLLPETAPHAFDLAARLADRLRGLPVVHRPLHGDFYGKQVLLAPERVNVLDLDGSVKADPALDLGNFIAHLERDRLRHGVAGERVEALREPFLAGYFDRADADDVAERLSVYAAIRLFLLVPHPFRFREPDWSERTTALLDRVEVLLGEHVETVAPPRPAAVVQEHLGDVEVDDPFDVAADPKLAFLTDALDPDRATRALAPLMPRAAGADVPFRLRRIRVVRHKPGRRCMIDYEVEVHPPGESVRRISLLGKVRAKGLNDTVYRLTEELWAGAFGPDAPDGIHVPEPIGCIPDFRMWLQRRVPGVRVRERLTEPGGTALAARMAGVLHKLHHTGPRTKRRHTLADELEILHERLPRVAEQYTGWADRIGRILDACDHLAARLPDPEPRPIHRDFYFDNVLVDGERIYLLDLDLYALGDPAVDAGNFIAHITEHSLRTTGDPSARADCETALAEAYGAGVDERTREAVGVYTTLTLVRHIELSTRLPRRHATTEPLLALSEDRLRAHDPAFWSAHPCSLEPLTI